MLLRSLYSSGMTTNWMIGRWNQVCVTPKAFLGMLSLTLYSQVQFSFVSHQPITFMTKADITMTHPHPPSGAWDVLVLGMVLQSMAVSSLIVFSPGILLVYAIPRVLRWISWTDDFHKGDTDIKHFWQTKDIHLLQYSTPKKQTEGELIIRQPVIVATAVTSLKKSCQP